MRILVILPLMFLAQGAQAETIACQFDKICELGKRCESTEHAVQFIKHEDNDTYAIVADASIVAVGLYSDHNGQQGTLVSRDVSATSTYEDIYVLSYTQSGNAVMSITGLASNDVPYSGTYTGQCEVGK